MDWPAVITTIIRRIPIERVLFPARDNTGELIKFLPTIEDSKNQNKALPEQKTIVTTQETPSPQRQENIATACVPCALGHFSTSAGLLNESVRFKAEGITSNEILDRIAKALEEQNALERVDLASEKIRSAPGWERDIAEEALQKSRSLRHRLETIQTVYDLEQAAADTEDYYRNLNREWWKRRFAKLDKAEKPEMSLEDAKKMAAEQAAIEVEKQWDSHKTK